MTKAGIYLPVGIQGEYAGRDSDYIWDRVLYLAKLAEELGFQTIRVPDHLMNCRADDDAPTLSPEEEAGIEAALESYRQGRVVDARRARQIIDAALGR